MLKPLTLSLALAAAFGITTVSLAGGHGCTNCGIASPQGSVVSPQSYVAGPCDTCEAPKHHFSMPKICLPKISLPKISLPKPTYTYEWVLKKKRVWGHKNTGCGEPACDSCGVLPSSQAAPLAAPQAAPQAAPAYGAPQAAGQSAGVYGAPAKTVAIDSVPPAPEVGGSLLSLTPAR
ncbi:MAG: hypothetical protein SFX72_00965 [Isosphaeraceae bacterium]|nr:hypothetical protein [Isosphaeraceae bacterium]